MRALTIRQPWAWAILIGRKRVENRSWSTRFRGRLLVHAAARPWAGATTPLGEVPPLLPLGAIVGSVEVVDCVPVAELLEDRFAFGPWCWVLRDPEMFRHPIPYRGRLGLYVVDHATSLLASAASIAGPQ